MHRSRGFKLGHKLARVFKWAVKPKRKLTRHQELDYQTKSRSPISRFCKLARSLQRGAKELCSLRSDPGYKQLGQPPFVEEVPKGHLAVYVGSEDDNACRILVPVIYFNHPLFSELLKEAENVYGYDHPGGITIPCGMSRFEKVQSTIAAGVHGCRRSWRRRYW